MSRYSDRQHNRKIKKEVQLEKWGRGLCSPFALKTQYLSPTRRVGEGSKGGKKNRRALKHFSKGADRFL